MWSQLRCARLRYQATGCASRVGRSGRSTAIPARRGIVDHSSRAHHTGDALSCGPAAANESRIDSSTAPPGCAQRCISSRAFRISPIESRCGRALSHAMTAAKLSLRKGSRRKSAATTGENITVGGTSANMPSITFEVDPNRAASPSNFSSLVFTPANSTANQWSPYIDATTSGLWEGTGAAFTGSQCDQERLALHVCRAPAVPGRWWRPSHDRVGGSHQGSRLQLAGGRRRPPRQRQGLRLRGDRRRRAGRWLELARPVLTLPAHRSRARGGIDVHAIVALCAPISRLHALRRRLRTGRRSLLRARL